MMKNGESSAKNLEKRGFFSVRFRKPVAWFIILVFFISLLFLAQAEERTRMMEGAEKAAWDSTPWDHSPLLVEIELTRNRAWYTFGYTFGYLGEQCVTAAISAGTVTLGIIIAKNGTVLISKLAPRAMGVLAIRLHFIKEALVAMDFADDAARYAHEGMMSSAARTPTTPALKEIPVSFMENRMAAQSFDRATFNFKEWVKTAVPDGNVRKLIKTPAGRDVFSKRTSQLMHLLGDECDAVTMKNLMKAAEERVVVVHPDGTVDEYVEGFFRAFEGNSSLIGGLALGLDRIAMLIAGEESIREVIAFPKNNKGADLMSHSPCQIGPKELRDVYIQSTWKDPKAVPAERPH